MLKRNAIIKFVLITIIAILGMLLCVCPFSVPYSNSQYNGFLGAINKGVDLEGGVSAIYECTLKDGQTDELPIAIDDSLSKIEDIFKSERFSQLYVERQGGNRVYVMTSADAYKMNKAFYYIEEGKQLNFTSAKVSDTLTDVDVYVDCEDLKNVKPDYSYDDSVYGITVEFTTKGYDNLKKLKEVADKTTDKTIYAYLGDVQEKNFFAEIKTEDIDDTMFITSASGSGVSITSADDARKVAYSVTGGMLSVDLSLKEVSEIGAVFGKNTKLYIGICFIALIVVSFILLCFRYGQLGLVGSLALVFNLIFFTFLLQSIPFMTFNIAGVVGSLASYLLACFAIVTIFENARSEYAMGKKLYLSCKGGFKKSLVPILDSHALAIIIAIFLWIIAPASMKCFGIVLLIGSLLSMFISLLLLRWFVNMYLNINSTKAKKLRFKRDENLKEVIQSAESEQVEVEVIPPEEAVNE